jgi:hypothetical protein
LSRPLPPQGEEGALLDFYLDQHVHLNRTPGAYQFLGEQVARLRAQFAGGRGRGAPWEAVQREKDLLAQANVRLVGAVLNKWRRHTPGWLQRCL